MRNNILKIGALFTLFTLITLIIVLILTFTFKKELEEEVFENHDFYQYLSGIKFDYTGNLKITKNKEITELNIDNYKVILDTTPLYFTNESKVLFPKTMSIVLPKASGVQYKIPYFSKIIKEDDIIYLKRGDKKTPLNNSFIYDGVDLYFFIEETTIKVGDTTIKLSPMSYIILNYFDNIQIYDYENKEYKTININEDIYAESSGYKVNLSIDAVVHDGSSRLLIKNLDYLKKYK